MMKITINIQEELLFKLKQFIPSGKISKFISDSIKKELNNKETALLKAYQEAYRDPARNRLADEWDVLNTEITEETNPKIKKH